ncbi:NAD kinase 2, mitochondrial isoform X2 [Planococcus citri]|uniref:NAD kinase 2, mitochondrial isoform X2 n=1 Tax=Planococcus citri TaxID=170843 RepID=UPI0031F86ADA
MKLFTSFRLLKRSMTGLSQNAASVEDYNLQKVLLVSKTTRFEAEQNYYSNSDDAHMRELLLERGSAYLLRSHEQHKKFEKELIKYLEKSNVEVKIVDRYERPKELIDWADTIMSVGGDGTFLMAANKVADQSKPVFGFNSFPERSTGYLCLPKACSDEISKTINEIKQRRFTWAYRSRIKIQIQGKNINTKPFGLHDKWSNRRTHIDQNNSPDKTNKTDDTFDVPYLALNEVFIAENSPATVSYLDVSVDDGEYITTKSSGMCICTGSGSSSWNYTMNRISEDVVRKLFSISGHNNDNIDEIVEKYNSSLRFNSDDDRIDYTIRDMIPMPCWPKMPNLPPKAFAKKIAIRSQCREGSIVIDGGYSYAFNAGATVILQTDPTRKLKTIRLNDPVLCPDDC